jgi:hypothetical protein
MAFIMAVIIFFAEWPHTPLVSRPFQEFKRVSTTIRIEVGMIRRNPDAGVQVKRVEVQPDFLLEGQNKAEEIRQEEHQVSPGFESRPPHFPVIIVSIVPLQSIEPRKRDVVPH